MSTHEYIDLLKRLESYFRTRFMYEMKLSLGKKLIPYMYSQP